MAKKIKNVNVKNELDNDLIENIDIETEVKKIIKKEKITSYEIVKIIDVDYGIVIVDTNRKREVKINMSDFQLKFILNNKHKYIGKYIEIELEDNKVLPLNKFEVKLERKKELCNILSIWDNGYDIQFKNHVITISAHNIDKDLLKSQIEIYYEGEYGKNGFKIIPIYV